MPKLSARTAWLLVLALFLLGCFLTKDDPTDLNPQPTTTRTIAHEQQR